MRRRLHDLFGWHTWAHIGWKDGHGIVVRCDCGDEEPAGYDTMGRLIHPLRSARKPDA